MRFYVTTPALLGILVNPLDYTYRLTLGKNVSLEVKEHIRRFH
jgi:hypothetical protein